MEKIGIDMNHFILYLDDMISRQKSFITDNYELFNKLKEVINNKDSIPGQKNMEVDINIQEVIAENDSSHSSNETESKR